MSSKTPVPLKSMAKGAGKFQSVDSNILNWKCVKKRPRLHRNEVI